MQGSVVLQVSYIFGDVMKSLFSQVLLFVAGTLLIASVQAEGLKPNEVVPVLGGEAYSKVARISSEPGVLVYRYVRENETFEDWTTAATYILFRQPEVGDRPKSVAAGIVSGLQSTNPQAQYNLTGNEAGTKAFLDFLTWPVDKEFMEYNVYRLEAGASGEGVYALQISVKFPYVDNMSETQLKEVVSLRNALIKQADQYNMKSVKKMLSDRYSAVK